MQHIQLDPAVKTFFVRFARLEYALKRAGYVKTRGSDTGAEADWSAFAKRRASDFNAMLRSGENRRLVAAIQFIRNDPPRKLVLLDKGNSRQLCWKRTGTTVANLDGLLVLVRRIRNNLFHGEKPETSIGGNQRGAELIKSAQQIIDACLSLDLKVRRYFEASSPPIPRLDA